MAAKSTSIDQYLATISTDKRTALQKLRKAIRAAAPQAVECISYQLPAFKLKGRMLAAFGAAANHCAFYPTSYPLEVYRDELKSYDTSKGALRFPANKPLPATLVRKLVKAQMERIDQKQEKAKPARSTAKKRAGGTSRSAARIDPAVDDYLRALKHPRKSDIELVRQIILGIDPGIREGIKWNSPSFRTNDYFATVNLRVRGKQDHVWLILHTGAKAKKIKDVKIDDPDGLLEWLAKDRCLVTFVDGKEIQKKRKALEAILRQWIRLL